MKRKKLTENMRRIGTVALLTIMSTTTLAMPLEACASEAGNGGHWYDSASEEHSDADYDEMVYTGADEAGDADFLERLQEDVTEEKSDSEISADYEEMIDRLNYASTQVVLNELILDKDPLNDEAADADIYLQAYALDLADSFEKCIRDILNGPNGEAMEAAIGDEELVDSIREYEELTPRQKELQEEENELIQEYQGITSRDTVVTLDSVEYTISSAFEAYEEGKIEYEDYFQVYNDTLKTVNEETTPIYIQLVKDYNEEARSFGYDNFAEYAYSELYERDFTTEDIKSVYSGVKEYIVPLYNELQSYDTYDAELDERVYTEEEKIDLASAVIPQVDPELEDAWDYLTEHHLYDIEPSDTKAVVGYTVDLYSYGSPFIFDDPSYGNYNDLETLIHEFGHFNAMYHENGNVFENSIKQDICEIHSQGLELLALEYADQLYGEDNAETVRYRILANICGAVIDACVFDEFQVAVYSYEGELDADTINDMFAQIARSYGGRYDSGEWVKYYWTMIDHNFSSPMYYISYGTSALAALDIFAMSVEDRQAGVDCYMNLTTYGCSLDYRELLNEVGLPDIFEEGTIQSISEEISDYVDDCVMESLLDTAERVAEALLGILVIAVVIVIIAVKLSGRNKKTCTGQYVTPDRYRTDTWE